MVIICAARRRGIRTWHHAAFSVNALGPLRPPDAGSEVEARAMLDAYLGKRDD